MNVTKEICQGVFDYVQEEVIAAILFTTVCTASDGFLLVVIKRTPTFRGFSGLLLINNQVANLVDQLIAVITLMLSFIYQNRQLFGHYSLVLKKTWMNLSLFLLLGISFNLYVAICKSTLYSRIITQKRGYLVIVSSYVVSFTLGLSPIIDGSVNDGCVGRTSLWLLVLYLIYGVGSVAANIWFLYKVLKHTRSHGSISRHTQERLKQSKLIFVLCVSNTLMFVSLCVAFFIVQNLTSTALMWNIVYPLLFISKMYTFLRLYLHLALYRPLLETTKSLLRCCPRHNRVSALATIPVTAAGPYQRTDNTGHADSRRNLSGPHP